MSNEQHSVHLETPKLRPDLVFGRQEFGDRNYVVIKDPETGDFYRLNDAEHFVARQFNGDTPMDVVRQRAEERFGGTLSTEALQAFALKLERAGLLETGGTKSRKKKARGRLQGSLFYLRYRLLDPDRVLNQIGPFVRPLFTPGFVGFSGFMILSAVLTAILNWNEFLGDLSSLVQWSSIPLVFCVSFLAVSLHEFAHALTCKHFGGTVREMGFMLIFLQPALYCNVSDAWLFPEKSRRLWVGFAGPYFELFLWALATMTWRMTGSGSIIHDFCLIVMATSGIKTLLNFNPLIKYDGYYLLSDWLEIPNLRKKSFRYVGDLFKRWFGVAITEAAGERAPSPREARIFLWYGILGTVGTAIFTLSMIMVAGDIFISGNELIAGLLLLIVGTRFRRRLRKLFRGSSNDDDDAATPALQDTGPATAVEPKRKRKAVQNDRRTFWMALAALLALFLFFGTMQLRIAGPFAILPVHNADVRTEVEGIVFEVLVTEGDRIRAGDVIARLSGTEQLAELEKTEAQIKQAGAKLAMQEAGPTKEEIHLARTTVAKAEDRLEFARIRAERNRILFEKGLVPKTEYENALELSKVAEGDLAEARSKLAVLLRGPRPEEIEATRAELLRLEAHRAYLTRQIEKLEVRSQVDGIVATPARQLKEMEGQLIQKGALVARVYDLRRLTVEIPVPENEIADVAVGHSVAFKARAFPNQTFSGTVTSVGVAARGSSSSPPSGSGAATGLMTGLPAPTDRVRTILVTTEVDNSSLLLKPGMTGEAKIYCGERRIIELILRRLMLTVGVELWSWW